MKCKRISILKCLTLQAKLTRRIGHVHQHTHVFLGPSQILIVEPVKSVESFLPLVAKHGTSLPDSSFQCKYRKCPSWDRLVQRRVCANERSGIQVDGFHNVAVS